MKDPDPNETTPYQKLYEKAPKEETTFSVMFYFFPQHVIQFCAAVTSVLVQDASNFASLSKKYNLRNIKRFPKIFDS